MTETPPDPPGSGTLPTVLRLLIADVPPEIMNAPQNWPRWAALLPHVLAATGHFSDSQHKAQQSGRDDVSSLLDHAATYLQVHGRLAEARPLAERALAITETAHGSEDAVTAVRLNNLGLLLRDLGQLAEARPLAERALAITEATFGPDHPHVAIRLSNLATILSDLGQPAEARPLAERALAIAEATYGPDHPTVALCRRNLAAILRDLGEAAQSDAAD